MRAVNDSGADRDWDQLAGYFLAMLKLYVCIWRSVNGAVEHSPMDLLLQVHGDVPRS